MPRLPKIALTLVVVLSGCGHRPDTLQAPMDKIRVMVKQSISIAVQAACTAPPARSDLVRAAVVSLRRATAGPEMARIHRMMGQMEADKPGQASPGSEGQSLSPQQKMHLAIHRTGGDGFDLLDGLTRKPALTCEDVRPVSLAVAAALLRENRDGHTDAATEKLDREIEATSAKLDKEVSQQLNSNTPEVVRALAVALQKI